MAKGQKRSNREARKPKKKKEPPAVAPVVAGKGTAALNGIQKRKY